MDTKLCRLLYFHGQITGNILASRGKELVRRCEFLHVSTSCVHLIPCWANNTNLAQLPDQTWQVLRLQVKVIFTVVKQLKQLLKFWGSNGIQSHDLCNTGVMLYQLSYEASLEAGQEWVILDFYGKFTGKILADTVSSWCEGLTSNLFFVLQLDATLHKHTHLSWESSYMKENLAQLHSLLFSHHFYSTSSKQHVTILQ